MKHFAVELMRTSYVTVYVEAETKDQAENLAWLELQTSDYDDSDVDWECSDIYEQFATDETRSNG
jgi:hypothetical protein